MNKTKIDWADRTFNPVTGCLHDCEYCYARRIARRFGNPHNADGNCHEINQLRVRSYHAAAHHTGPYPYGFDPTLYRDRLDEPAKLKKPQTIFVCSMADLFGEWVPDEWIQEVFAACERAPQHRYLFLTKNPERYQALYQAKAFPYSDNFWFGSTVTKPHDPFAWFKGTPYKSFVSIEPILEPFGELVETDNTPNWIIIGAETGKRKEKVIPERWWVEEIVAQCRDYGIPIFMKESLREMMGEDFVQEFPW